MKRKQTGKGSAGILICILLILILTMGLALLFAKLILSEVIAQKNLQLCASAIALMVSFVTGMIGAKKTERRKFLWGISSCGILFLVLLISNLLFFGVSFQNVPMIGAGILVGGIPGSLLGKKKVRKYA